MKKNLNPLLADIVDGIDLCLNEEINQLSKEDIKKLQAAKTALLGKSSINLVVIARLLLEYPEVWEHIKNVMEILYFLKKK